MFDPSLPHPLYSIPTSFNLENWSAFPSDTAAFFFALAFGIVYLSRRFTVPIMLYTAGWICLPRLYLGIHYASDILGGAVIGIATVWILVRTDWLHSLLAAPVVAFAEKCPEWFYAIAFLVSFELADVFNDIRNVGRAVLHIAHIQSYSHWVAAIIGFGFAAGYLLIVLYRKLGHRGRATARGESPGEVRQVEGAQVESAKGLRLMAAAHGAIELHGPIRPKVDGPSVENCVPDRQRRRDPCRDF